MERKYFWHQVVARIYILWTSTFRYRGNSSMLEHGSLMACYHQNIFSFLAMARFFYKEYRISALISAHEDGDLVALLCQKHGLVVVRGSSKRMKKRNYIRFMKILKEGFMAVFILDGPIGPAKSVEMGILLLAEKFKRPIQAFFFYPKPVFQFKRTWDMFQLPFPFAKINYRVTKKFFYDSSLGRKSNLEKFKSFLEEQEVAFEKPLK